MLPEFTQVAAKPLAASPSSNNADIVQELDTLIAVSLTHLCLFALLTQRLTCSSSISTANPKYSHR
jgi:hypothetical protein